MVWSDKHKNHFRLGVKFLLEKLIKKFGYQKIFGFLPSEFEKVLKNIKKKTERKVKLKETKGGAKQHAGFENFINHDDAGEECFYAKKQVIHQHDNANDEYLPEILKDSLYVAPNTVDSGKKGKVLLKMDNQSTPMNLLDQKSMLGNVVSAKQVSKKRATVEDTVPQQFNHDGKFIFDENNAQECFDEDAVESEDDYSHPKNNRTKTQPPRKLTKMTKATTSFQSNQTVAFVPLMTKDITRNSKNQPKSKSQVKEQTRRRFFISK